MRKTLTAAATAAAAAFSIAAQPALAQQHHQHSPYAGMEQRDIKALSDEQVSELREGRGMGASLPAELNGVPGPMHVLQLKDRLKVTADQQAALEQIVARMKASAQRLGSDVIETERRLDGAFRGDQATEQDIRALTARIGSLNAELRATHLVAHLQTRQVLSEAQVHAYNEARGYAVPKRDGHLHRH
jgi:hypothetical protein